MYSASQGRAQGGSFKADQKKMAIVDEKKRKEEKPVSWSRDSETSTNTCMVVILLYCKTTNLSNGISPRPYHKWPTLVFSSSTQSGKSERESRCSRSINATRPPYVGVSARRNNLTNREQKRSKSGQKEVLCSAEFRISLRRGGLYSTPIQISNHILENETNCAFKMIAYLGKTESL